MSVVDAGKLTWGLKDPSIIAPAIWGARCIPTEWESRSAGKPITRRMLDVVWDRQDFLGSTQAKAELQKALNEGGALDALRTEWSRGTLHNDTGRGRITVIGFKGVRFFIHHTGGYVYLAATKEEWLCRP